MGRKRIYTEDEKLSMDREVTRAWYPKNKEKKSLLNKKWRQENDSVAYLQRFRKIAKLKKELSNFNFYATEKGSFVSNMQKFVTYA